MNHASSLLAELDSRQDDVLQQLDALNQRIEETLRSVRETGLTVGNASGAAAGRAAASD